MERENTVFAEELNPTFLFMWKGTRVEDEPNYHCHEHLELCYIQSGTGKHRIGDTIYEVKEGDLLVINEGVYHQSLAGEHKTPVAEFYVGLTDLNLAGLGRNHFPLPGNCPVFRTEGELQRKLSKLCMAMEAEQELCRIGALLRRMPCKCFFCCCGKKKRPVSRRRQVDAPLNPRTGNISWRRSRITLKIIMQRKSLLTGSPAICI